MPLGSSDSFRMSAGRKYRRTNFEDDDNASAGEASTPPGAIYDPGVIFGAPTTFCQRRSALEKCCLALVCVLVTVIVVLAALLASYPGAAPHTPAVGGEGTTAGRSGGEATSTRTPPTGGLCLSKGCITVASSILNSIDESVDPCDDFYQYACGSWVKGHPIPPGESRWDTFGVLRKENQLILKNLLEAPQNASGSAAVVKAQVYYASCLDVNKTLEALGAQPLLNIMRKFGGWAVSPAAGPHAPGDWDLQRTLEDMQDLGLTNFFNLWVSDDEKEPTKNVLQLDEGGIELQRDQYLNKTIRDDRVLTAYLTFMTEVGVMLGGERNATQRFMADVIVLEQKIANLTAPMEERRDQEKMYHKLNISTLQGMAPFLNWKSFINTLLQDSDTSYKVNDSEPIIVKAPQFLTQMSELILNTMATPEGNITLNNYMMWHLVKAACSGLSKPFRDARKEFYRKIYGSTGEEEQWRYCVADTENVLGFAVGAMFVRETFHGESKQAAVRMINYVKAAFKENLPKLQWMDDGTRAAANEKADAVVNMIGFPEYILNKTLLDERYKELSVDLNEYFVNNINSMKYTVKRNLLKLRKTPDKESWSMAPSAVNAYYTPTKNQIVFPAGILQAPFFDKDFPYSLNFGAIGVVVGHELTHGFDDQGREFDKTGMLVPWWNASSVEKFKKRAQCMSDQYSRYSLYGENVRGKQTLGENIADNGGVKSAFYAYKRWAGEHGAEAMLPGLNLTHEQLFFISFAQVWCTNSRQEDYHMSVLSDTHSPHRFRVIGSVSNSQEFATQFKCSAAARMNPTQKCEVW